MPSVRLSPDDPGYPRCTALLPALRVPVRGESMSENDSDGPKHQGTPADETPFDHGCECEVCRNYRTEVRAGVTGEPPVTLTDKQMKDLRRLIRERYDGQMRLDSFA